MSDDDDPIKRALAEVCQARQSAVRYRIRVFRLPEPTTDVSEPPGYGWECECGAACLTTFDSVYSASDAAERHGRRKHYKWTVIEQR